jgi:hypothetical protein
MKVARGNPLKAAGKEEGRGDGEKRIQGVNLTNAQHMHV